MARPAGDNSRKDRAVALAVQAKQSRAGRAGQRYSEGNGNVLAGGIAYFSLTSIAAGLVIAVTLSTWLVGRNPQAQQAVADFLAQVLPGWVSGAGEEGLVDPESIRATPMTGLVGLIAFVVLFYTATRALGALRGGVRTMLGDQAGSGVPGKVRDLIALGLIAALVLVGALLQVAASYATSALAEAIYGEPGSAWLLRGPALLVTLLVDVAFVWMALVVLGRARTPARRLWPVVAATAVAIGVLRLTSALVIGGAAGNPVLAPFATLITVLVFADFVARLVLLSAAWLGAGRSVSGGSVGSRSPA